MNKTIELGIAERILLIGIFNQVKGDIETLKSVLEDVKGVSISEEEKTEINFREVKNEEGKTTSFAWDKSDPKEAAVMEVTDNDEVINAVLTKLNEVYLKRTVYELQQIQVVDKG